jgi:hypothetical protein
MDCTQDLHHQQQLEQQQWEEARRNMTPVYCDKIANTIRIALNTYDHDGIIIGCGSVKLDLHPEGGYLVSTKKTMFAIDSVGRHYKITVEEV